MHQDAQSHDGRPPDVLHQRPEQQAADGVDAAEADHHVADLGDAQGAGDEALGEIGADEGLLHAYVHGDGDEELLVGFLQLVGRGGEEFDGRHLRLAVPPALLLPVSVGGEFEVRLSDSGLWYAGNRVDAGGMRYSGLG